MNPEVVNRAQMDYEQVGSYVDRELCRSLFVSFCPVLKCMVFYWIVPGDTNNSLVLETL